MTLESNNLFMGGKAIRMNAKTYIYLCCKSSGIAILPSEIHMDGGHVYLQDSQARHEEVARQREAMSTVEEIMLSYEAKKKELGVQLFAFDGSAVRREGYDEIVHTEAQFDYFEKNIWGKDSATPILAALCIRHIMDG